MVNRDAGYTHEGQGLGRAEGGVHEAEGGDGETQDSDTQDPGDPRQD